MMKTSKKYKSLSLILFYSCLLFILYGCSASKPFCYKSGDIFAISVEKWDLVILFKGENFKEELKEISADGNRGYYFLSSKGGVGISFFIEKVSNKCKMPIECR